MLVIALISCLHFLLDLTTYFAEVILPLAVPNTFTYRLPQNMEPYARAGQRVVVPFNRGKLLTGIIERIHTSPPSAYAAKYIDCILDEEPVMTDLQLLHLRWIAKYYMCNIGEVLLAALPTGLRLSSESVYVPNPAFDGDVSNLNQRELSLLEAMGHRESVNLQDITQILGISTVQPTLKALLSIGAILIYENLKERYKPRFEDYIKLSAASAGEDGLRAAFASLERSPKKLEVLMQYVQASGAMENPENALRKLSFQKLAKTSSSIIAELVKKGIFELERREVDRLKHIEASPDSHFELSLAQTTASAEIKSQFNAQKVVLLEGITSSGKTEIYIKLIEEQLGAGKQVLYLLPEIALTTQMIHRLERYFGPQLTVYHSRFTQDERVEVWNLVLGNTPDRGRLILGARSAIFLPFRQLGLIIVDEEHEPSFKQHEPAPRYHARDAALRLAQLHDAKVLLGSATPAFETMTHAINGKYGHVRLTERYGEGKLPKIDIVSLKTTKQSEKEGFFSEQLIEAIAQTLDRDEQVILFQNRRGYAPILLCEICGHVPECTRCDVSLTYHKAQKRLVCHYCGNKYSIAPTCGACGSVKLRLAGFGTQRIEEELEVKLPKAKLARLDLDSTRTKNAYHQILSDFGDGVIDILIGTQMVTKGLDFGKVSLVGILHADLLLKFPDFRATERGFQLMTQVAGRAGRRDTPGKVIIQTSDPDQWILKQVKSTNYTAVYDHEIAERKKYVYPPFSRLILLIFRHSDSDLVDFASAWYHKELATFFPEGNMLGPEYPAVARVKNRFNKQLILKIAVGMPLSLIKGKMEELHIRFAQDKTLRAVRIIVNVDPQ